MTEAIEGNLDASGRRFAIVAARFNSMFADRLIEGATGALVRHGADEDAITVVRCPGSYELPQVDARVADVRNVDAVICLGVLIRGATPHFDYIASAASSGISTVGVDTGVPTAFGVITCDTVEQAAERSGSKAGNKGAEAAVAALEMVNLFDAIDESADE